MVPSATRSRSSGLNCTPRLCRRGGIATRSAGWCDAVAVEWKLLAGLADNEREELLGHGRRRRFAKGDIVFHEGDPAHVLHLVAAGRFAVRVTTPLGSTATLDVVGPGGWFGELAIVSDAPRNATVAALEPSETLALQRAQVDDIRRRDATVDRVLIGALVDELRRTSA